jgi:hypothetical protein
MFIPAISFQVWKPFVAVSAIVGNEREDGRANLNLNKTEQWLDVHVQGHILYNDAFTLALTN